MDCSPPGSSVHRNLQARILEWVAIPSSRKIFLTQELNLFLLYFQGNSLPYELPERGMKIREAGSCWPNPDHWGQLPQGLWFFFWAACYKICGSEFCCHKWSDHCLYIQSLRSKATKESSFLIASPAITGQSWPTELMMLVPPQCITFG